MSIDEQEAIIVPVMKDFPARVQTLKALKIMFQSANLVVSKTDQERDINHFLNSGIKGRILIALRPDSMVLATNIFKNCPTSLDSDQRFLALIRGIFNYKTKSLRRRHITCIDMHEFSIIKHPISIRFLFFMPICFIIKNSCVSMHVIYLLRRLFVL